MIPASIALNPFALMMDPSRVIATMERSEQLRELRHHEYRPLDKPLIAHRSSRPLHDFDVVIEAASAADELDEDPTDALSDAILGLDAEPLLN